MKHVCHQQNQQNLLQNVYVKTSLLSAGSKMAA